MSIFIYCNRKSKSARTIAKALGLKKIKLLGPKVLNNGQNTIINWGSSNVPYDKCKIINRPEHIQLVLNKLVFLKSASDNGTFRVPPWTCDKQKALEWLQNGYIVLARKILCGSGGKGIVIIESNNINSLIDAPLYVRYIRKISEYRLHYVRNGNLDIVEFDAQKKTKKLETDVKCHYIRSHNNGYIFQRNGIEPIPEDVRLQSSLAFKFSNLDFGAIDVIATKNGKAYVLEINTAPGLEGQTVDHYSEAIKSHIINNGL